MQNTGTKDKKWRAVKAKIIVRFGSIAKCAREIDCTPEAVRLAVAGRCPRVKIRLLEALS
jgi:hypothetical protein